VSLNTSIRKSLSPGRKWSRTELRKGVREKHLIQTEFAVVARIKAMTSSCERGNELSVPWSATDWLLASEEGPRLLSKWWTPVRLITGQTHVCHVNKMAELSNHLTSTDGECAIIQGVSCSSYFRILHSSPPDCTAVHTKRITVINLNSILAVVSTQHVTKVSRGVETKLHSLWFVPVQWNELVTIWFLLFKQTELRHWLIFLHYCEGNVKVKFLFVLR
jgi:hypothetical protein